MSFIEKIKKDLEILDQKNITYITINNVLKRNEEGIIKKAPIMDKIKYRDILCKTKYNPEHNSCLIMLGERYNLIGIDVDNKEDTVNKYHKIMKNNDAHKTLTIKTVNKGYHYYYRLTDKQKKLLNKFNFKSKNDAIFGLKIDVKYDNQVFFGPSRFNFENRTYRYYICDDTDPIILPDFIFNELMKSYKCNKCDNMCDSENIKTKLCNKCLQLKETKIENNKKEKEDTLNDTPKVGADILEKYLECLNIQRFSGYQSWLYIGAIIYNEGGNFDIFNKYSMKANNYDKNSCIHKWKEFAKFRGNRVTILTLMKWAKEDNPTEYTKIRKRSINDEIEKIIIGTWSDNDLTHIFRLVNPDNIIYCDRSKRWYVLNSYNIWEYECSLTLINIVSETLPKLLPPIYKKVLKNITDDLNNAHPSEVKEKSARLKYVKENYSKLYKYCSSIVPQNRIVEKLKSVYYDKLFHEKVDDVNSYLFAFKNGVYDLKNDEFRLPTPDELISETVNYEYFENINEDKMKIMGNIINEIFLKNKKDKDGQKLKKYVMTTIAQCLAGVICSEDFFIWIGQGRNGKGIIRDMIKATFGPYFDSMEIEELDKTRVSSSNSADINMAKKRHCRIVISTEPDSAMQLKTNKIAQWTGGDPITCRYNYDRTTFDYVPKWKLFIQSNYDLSFPGKNIKAFTERTNMIRFPFCFVDDNKLEHEKPKDPLLKQKLKDEEFKIIFFHYLLKYYRRFSKTYVIKKPDVVKQETDILFATADPITPFFKDMIIKVDDNSKFVGSQKLYQAFKEYYSANDVDIKINAQEFKACLKEKGLKPSIKDGRIIWRNIILLTKEEFDKRKNQRNGEFDDNDIDF